VRPLLVSLALLGALACHREPLHDFPSDVVDNFLAACRSKGGPDDACQCALDGLRRRFTAEEYAALEKNVRDGDQAATKVLADVVVDCRE
jgi:hypothetical protein